MNDKKASADDLVKTPNVELTEDELSKASGGFLKITMTNVYVSNNSLGGGGDRPSE